MAEQISLDFSNALAGRVGRENGATESALQELQPRADAIHAELQGRREAGELGFFELPYDRDAAVRIAEFAAEMARSFANYVHVGIGGSALGPKALQRALHHPYFNLLPAEDRGGAPRMFFLENIDPDSISGLFDCIDASKTLFNIVTKSGSTAETAAAFLVVVDALKKHLGPKWKNNLVLTTDPVNGDLRALARAENIFAFAIPPSVGGRFSVLTAVGLLPAAISGIEIDALLAGAADMDRRCRGAGVLQNPAYTFAALHYLANTRHGKANAVMMPYADSLFDLADWFCQLWAESLGKAQDIHGKAVHVGQTPIKALGAVDQHSQVQLYIEGPNDKIFTFLRVEHFRRQVKMAPEFASYKSYGYLGGKTMNQLINVEQQATAAALADHGRPNLTLIFPRVTAYSVGEFFYLLEVATAFAGGLYQINAFDQPGVEHGKKLTYKMMGRG